MVVGVTNDLSGMGLRIDSIATDSFDSLQEECNVLDSDKGDIFC